MAGKSDIKNVADLELGTGDPNSLTTFQQQMYLPDKAYLAMTKGIPYKSEDDEETIDTPFYKKIRKIMMSVDITDKMTMTPGKPGEFIYTVNDKMDFLLYVYMYRKFPGYKVLESLKDKVQICWTHNLGHNGVVTIELVIDGDSKQTITNTWLDIYSQYFMKPGFRKQYRKDIGDRKYSPQWTSELEPLTVKVPIPMFFDRRRNAALPLFLCSESKIVIKGTFRTKIAELIKMRIRKNVNDGWNEVPYRFQSIHGIKHHDEIIPEPPELHAAYARITSEEKEAWGELIKLNVVPTYKLYYDDVIIHKSDKVHTAVEPFSQELMCPNPAKGIFWVAQNQEGLRFNNYSNYTTDALSIDQGKHPINKVSMKHGGTTSRFQDMDFDHFDSIPAYYRLPSTPFEPGYQCAIYSPNIMGTDADIGPIFSQLKTTLAFTLESTKYGVKNKEVEIKQNEDFFDQIFTVEDKVDLSKLTHYKIFVFILYMKQMELSLGNKVKVYDGNERMRNN